MFLLLLLLNCASVLGCSCSLLLSLHLLFLDTANSTVLSVPFCYVYVLGRACSLILFVQFFLSFSAMRSNRVLVAWTVLSFRVLCYFLWIIDGIFHTYLPKNGIFPKFFSLPLRFLWGHSPVLFGTSVWCRCRVYNNPVDILIVYYHIPDDGRRAQTCWSF